MAHLKQLTSKDPWLSFFLPWSILVVIGEIALFGGIQESALNPIIKPLCLGLVVFAVIAIVASLAIIAKQPDKMSKFERVVLILGGIMLVTSVLTGVLCVIL